MVMDTDEGVGHIFTHARIRSTCEQYISNIQHTSSQHTCTPNIAIGEGFSIKKPGSPAAAASPHYSKTLALLLPPPHTHTHPAPLLTPYCRRHDMWVISSSPTLSPSAPSGWLALARSLWHGPDRDGKYRIHIRIHIYV